MIDNYLIGEDPLRKNAKTVMDGLVFHILGSRNRDAFKSSSKCPLGGSR